MSDRLTASEKVATVLGSIQHPPTQWSLRRRKRSSVDKSVRKILKTSLFIIIYSKKFWVRLHFERKEKRNCHVGKGAQRLVSRVWVTGARTVLAK